MDLKEFIKDFAENHQVQHIDDIETGVITTPITDEVYLVQLKDVTVH